WVRPRRPGTAIHAHGTLYMEEDTLGHPFMTTAQAFKLRAKVPSKCLKTVNATPQETHGAGAPPCVWAVLFALSSRTPRRIAAVECPPGALHRIGSVPSLSSSLFPP